MSLKTKAKPKRKYRGFSDMPPDALSAFLEALAKRTRRVPTPSLSGETV